MKSEFDEELTLQEVTKAIDHLKLAKLHPNGLISLF